VQQLLYVQFYATPPELAMQLVLDAAIIISPLRGFVLLIFNSYKLHPLIVLITRRHKQCRTPNPEGMALL